MSDRLDEAFEQLRRYAGEPDDRVLRLVEVLTDINDNLYNMRSPETVAEGIMKAEELLVEIAFKPELVFTVHQDK
ncbi:hypothetical protein ABDF71_21690 [Ochrobactrum sp. WV_118_8]